MDLQRFYLGIVTNDGMEKTAPYLAYCTINDLPHFQQSAAMKLGIENPKFDNAVDVTDYILKELEK